MNAADDAPLQEARRRCRHEGWRVKQIGEDLYLVTQLTKTLQMTRAELLQFAGIASP